MKPCLTKLKNKHSFERGKKGTRRENQCPISNQEMALKSANKSMVTKEINKDL
jgi:hypothetical protein